ncbi:hypothetical protein J3F84DRAFT_9501 [Trichoderma pleuroticola]
MLRRPSSRDGFHFAVICALPLEFDAVYDSLDEVWEEQVGELGKAAGDWNCYTIGRMGNTAVVLLLLPEGGKVGAASAAASLRSSYSNLSTVFVVGICGALPKLFDETETETEVLLGDVIISESVVQYDFGSQYSTEFKPKRSIEDMLGRPNKETRVLSAQLKTQRYRDKLEDSAFKLLQQLQAKVGETKRGGKYDYPGAAHDKLFDPDYRHKHQGADACDTCRACVSYADPVCERALELKCADLGCSNDYLIPRDRLRERERAEEAGSMGTLALVIHTGRVGSADTVMKSGEVRDRISQRDKVIAFESEGAGVWDELPSCIIIKGVSDYADCHKPKGWEKYAAATAASTTKALLLHYLEQRQTKAHTQNRIFSVPFAENHNFVGRESLVKSLIENLSDKRNDRVAVVGMGGVGKTQLALRIAYMMKNNQHGSNILWLPGFSMAGFEQACTDLVKKLNVPRTKDDDVRDLIKLYLSSEHVDQWLLILDNADGEDILQGSEGVQGIYAYLPRNRSVQILITTRWRKVAVDFAKQNVFEMAEMEHKDAKNLLQKTLRSEHSIWEDHTVDELLHLLTHLPLAIAQAAAYMDIFKVPVDEYLRLCRHSQQDMMELMRNQYQDDTLYDESQGAVATTWLVSVSQLQKYNPAAAKLLFFIMWIEPQAIPQSLLPDVGSQQEKTKAIGTLCSFGFLRARPERGMFDMHSLVHMVIQFWAHDQGIDTETKADMLDHLDKVFRSDEWEERDLWQGHLPHVLHVYRAHRQTDPISTANLGYWVVRCLLQNGRKKEALTVAEQVAEIRETTLPQDHPLRLASQLVLSGAYRYNGQIKEASMLLEKGFNHLKAALPQDHPRLLLWQHHLAEVYLRNEQVEEAIMLLEDVVKIQTTRLAYDHKNLLESQFYLAVAHMANEQIKEAIALLEHVVKIRATVLPQDHPLQLYSQYSLAIGYEADGQVKEAIALLEHLVKIEETALPQDHPARLESQCSLARTYEANGQTEEAIALLEHLVEGEESVLPQDHSARLTLKRLLAIT